MGVTELSRSEVAALRMASQRLSHTSPTSIEDAARHMTATQAQDFPASQWALALRAGETRFAPVRAAFDSGALVRSWPMRGTLHVVAAEDIGWMLSVTGERTLRGAATRQAELGLDDAWLQRGTDVVEQRLSSGGGVVRSELVELLHESGLPVDNSMTYRFIWYLAHHGLVCFGPMRGAEQEIVWSSDWIKNARTLDRTEAIVEWVRRYFLGHGPATVKDFSWWTKLNLTETRAAIAESADALTEVVYEGVPHWMSPEVLQEKSKHVKTARRTGWALPAFDEYLLGYQDRTAVLAPEFSDRIVPGGNGILLPTVVDAGEVVGTWKRAGTKKVTTVSENMFVPDEDAPNAFAASAAAFVAFHESRK